MEDTIHTNSAISEKERAILDIKSNEGQDSVKDRCTCKDEYVTAPCPVHHKVEIPVEHFGKRAAIITDNHMVPDAYRIWEGFVFICPYCKNESIMHFSKCCAECGKPVSIRSKIVTQHMKSLPKPR